MMGNIARWWVHATPEVNLMIPSFQLWLKFKSKNCSFTKTKTRVTRLAIKSVKCLYCGLWTGIGLLFKYGMDMIFEYIGPRNSSKKENYEWTFDFPIILSRFWRKFAQAFQSFIVFMDDDWCVMHFVNKVIIPVDLYAIKLIDYIRRKFKIGTLINTVEATVEVVLKNLFGHEALNELTSVISLTRVLNTIVFISCYERDFFLCTFVSVFRILLSIYDTMNRTSFFAKSH